MKKESSSSQSQEQQDRKVDPVYCLLIARILLGSINLDNTSNKPKRKLLWNSQRLPLLP